MAGAGAPFRERLAEAVAARRSSIVLGLDPDPARVWPEALDVAQSAAGGPAAGPEGAGRAGAGPERSAGTSAHPAAERAADAVVAHCAALIAAAGPACVAVKPQAACFERLGSPGWRALERVVDAARAAGLLVLLDAKRGDIGVSAQAYAEGLLTGTATPFGPATGLAADALTVNPYLGRDALEPFVQTGRGIFVLVRTSNPGATDLQDAELREGGRVWERSARLVDEIDANAVVGATAPEHLHRARELMPRATFLLPGVGAQGGRVEDLAPAFLPGPHGGLVTASRSIARAHEQHGGEPAQAAREEAERLREAAWALCT
ncbi:MAG TPA: orotidine-5'-phosphate decarboxylase [Solirubrobacteraceae bacterium]|jgi:orotidine-5'-phosphate decarboxylase